MKDLERAMNGACAIGQTIENIANIKEKSVLHPWGFY